MLCPEPEEESVRGLEFSILRKIYPVGAIVAICAFIVADRVAGRDLALGILTGGIFGVVNTWLIVNLTFSVIDDDHRNPLLALLIFTVKIPVVYGLLFWAFSKQLINLVGFAIGFQLFLLTLLMYGGVLYVKSCRKIREQGDDVC
jgi:hypothetical protein